MSTVQIHTLSAADFKHTMRNNDLYDGTVESVPELAVISIGNSFDDFDPDDIFSNGPASRWFRKPHPNVLNLTFDDITSPEKWKQLSSFGKGDAFFYGDLSGCEDAPNDGGKPGRRDSSCSEGVSGRGGNDGDSVERDYVLFDDNMARELAAFVDANIHARTWIVHCSAGVSRSGAVSRWLKDWLWLKHGIEAVNVDGKYAVPNSHVLAVLDRMMR